MNASGTRNNLANWARWPLVSLLSLAWGLGALISLTFGSLGQAGHSLAVWALAKMETLMPRK